MDLYGEFLFIFKGMKWFYWRIFYKIRRKNMQTQKGQ